MLVGESESLLRELVFAGQRGAEHRGIVAVERDHDAAVEITLCRMIVEIGTEAGAQVAGEADFDRALALGKLFHEIGIVEGGETVADALGAQVKRSPHRFRRARFTGVRRAGHAVGGGPRVGIAEKFRRCFLLVSADADADNFAIVIADGEFEDLLRRLASELTDSIEDPDERDAEITRAAGAAAIEAFENSSEIVIAPQADANRNVNFSVQNVFFFQELPPAVGCEPVIFGGAQVLGDVLEGKQEAGKIGVGVESLHLALSDPFAATSAEFEQRRRLDCALEVKMEFGLRQKAEEAARRPIEYSGHH